MKEELLKGLSEEQIAKIKACKNQEELLTLAKEEGAELTDEQLEAISGGCGTKYYKCPYCRGDARLETEEGRTVCVCPRCGTFPI